MTDVGDLERAAIDTAWAAVTGTGGGGPDVDLDVEVEVEGQRGHLPSPLPVERAAVAAVAAALRAAAALAPGAPPPVRLHRGHVAAAVRSERSFRIDGRPAGGGFAPLSRFWRAADGHVRVHANYPWHHQALLRALGAADEHVGEAIAALPAEEVEERVVAEGGVAAAVRDLDAWDQHPQGAAVAREPLVGCERGGGAAPRRARAGAHPIADLRVLDLTRVIAGPVGTRVLGALGADVLRLDPPGHLDLEPGAPADTLLGKRSALLDLAVPDALASLESLLADADVVVTGYRPGALERFGLAPAELVGRHPGLVVVVLSAWGHTGPWAGRRGFDSVVQAPSGIAAIEGGASGPGALPCQLLDHGTGYLVAAAALDGVRRQRAGGGSWVRRLSLARTARWLTSLPRDPDGVAPAATEAEEGRHLVELASAAGVVRAVAPPGSLGGEPLAWPSPTTTYGADRPAWPARSAPA